MTPDGELPKTEQQSTGKLHCSSALIGLFGDSNDNQIGLITGENPVSHVKITGYNKANVDKLEKAIPELPNPSAYTPGDSAVDHSILSAKSIFDSLPGKNKELVSDALVSKLAVLLSKLGNYILLDGDGQSVTAGTIGPLSFRASGPLAWFTGILMDGESVALDCYTVEDGSTVVMLLPGYVTRLAVGTHTLTFQYSNGGTVDTIFHVLPSPAAVANLPQTGDRSSLLLWAVLALLCVGGAAMLWARSKRK